MPASQPDVVIYHNPACGTSRDALALIRAAGIEPHVVEYLTTPPNQELMRRLLTRGGMTVRELLRSKEALCEELGLSDPSVGDDALLDAMFQNPVLINRPLVVSPRGVKLCRPADLVAELL